MLLTPNSYAPNDFELHLQKKMKTKQKITRILRLS